MRTPRAITEAKPILIGRNDVRDKPTSFWEQRYGHRLSDFEEKEIADNLSAVFGLLADWDRQARASANSVHEQDSANAKRSLLLTPSEKGESSHV